VSLGEISAALGPSSKLRGDREPGLSAEGWFYADHQVYPYGNHLAVVKVDPDTGGVTVLRYVIGYDIGRAINPMLVNRVDRGLSHSAQPARHQRGRRERHHRCRWRHRCGYR
jgi:hypothetical protein